MNNLLSLEDYRVAQNIFFKLLKCGELKEKEDKKLYLAYINQSGVREALSIISEESNVNIVLIDDTIYLIPNIDNDVLGFDIKREFDNKNILGSTNDEVYLSYLIITVIFAEFSNDIAPATYIEIPDILDLVSEAMNRALAREDIAEAEVEMAFNIKSSFDIWNSKIKWDEHDKLGVNTKSTSCQIGVVRRIITFLSKQKLVNVISDEDKIVPTKRFKDLMNGYFLNDDRKKEVEELLKIR